MKVYENQGQIGKFILLTSPLKSAHFYNSLVYCQPVNEEAKMNTNTILPSRKFTTPLFFQTGATLSLSSKLAALKSRYRFAAVAAVSFAVALPVLGALDPKVLWSAGLADANAASALIDRIEASLRNMAVTELFASGGVAVLTLAVAGLMSHLRKTAQHGVAEESAE